ncbi:LuxR C-terminal-related transcriptional regulator [Streptomyces sp. NPDC092307]|uniref:LuxR C-terminal-related transcriptional regulator n=1 Tax=Streptomyces sp. NPDC092307 TaxID=3366013 RepID=UPI00382C1161
MLVFKSTGMRSQYLMRRKEGAAHHSGRSVADSPTLIRIPAQRRRNIDDKSRAIPASGAAFLEMTDREREILSYVANGFSTKQIARRMAYSDRMIKYVLNGVVRKFRVCNRTQAVAFALRQGFIC